MRGEAITRAGSDQGFYFGTPFFEFKLLHFCFLGGGGGKGSPLLCAR